MLITCLKELFYNGWICLCAIVFTVIFSIYWGRHIAKHHKKDRMFTPVRILVLGTFISAIIYFLPIMLYEMGDYAGDVLIVDAILNSAQFAFRLFILDGEILWIFDPDSMAGFLSNPYTRAFYACLGSVLYFGAPILTFTFILTFFKNLVVMARYRFAFASHTHVFGELNEKTLALATDIKRLNYKDTVVFTEISDKVIEEQMELVEDAKMIGAILFHKDFDSIKYRFDNKYFNYIKRKLKMFNRRLSFYLISDDESKKLRHAEIVMKNYDCKDVELRLFSPDIRSQLLMDSLNPQNMRAIRIDDIQTLVYHNLYTYGKKLFDRARTVKGESDKVISAVIVGLGQYGTEMLKALTWFCQLEGYKLRITAFDSDKDAEAKFKYMCPELMHEDYNCKKNYGEPYYEIKIVSGIDVSTPKFREELNKITDASYIFVCLGTDEINLKTATEIRSICENINYGENAHKPDIETVVYDSKLAVALRTTWDNIDAGKAEGATFKDKPYNILITGDLDSFYSVSALIDSKLIDAGFDIQLGYDSNNDPVKKKDPAVIEKAQRTFWKYEYNYNSSTAQAIHLKLRSDMGCPRKILTDEQWENMTREQKIVHANPEHIRWNAYMRTRGYSRGARNDLGKRHPDLVPTNDLKNGDLRKD